MKPKSLRAQGMRGAKQQVWGLAVECRCSEVDGVSSDHTHLSLGLALYDERKKHL